MLPRLEAMSEASVRAQFPNLDLVALRRHCGRSAPSSQPPQPPPPPPAVLVPRPPQHPPGYLTPAQVRGAERAAERADERRALEDAVCEASASDAVPEVGTMKWLAVSKWRESHNIWTDNDFAFFFTSWQNACNAAGTEVADSWLRCAG